MENYIVINGKRIDLTKEQIEALGLKIEKKSDFNKVEKWDTFYSIYHTGTVNITTEDDYLGCRRLYQTGNYCTNKDLMTERAKEEVLSRLLWRFSMENGGKEIDWSDNKQWKYFIYLDKATGKWEITGRTHAKAISEIHFINSEIAQKALDEIVIPFYKGELEVCKIWKQ